MVSPGVTQMFHLVMLEPAILEREHVPCAGYVQNCNLSIPGTLIKVTQPTEPMEQLSIFKGPLPSTFQNAYMLTVIDKYSHFLFEFPYASMNLFFHQMLSAA